MIMNIEHFYNFEKRKRTINNVTKTRKHKLTRYHLKSIEKYKAEPTSLIS